MPLKCVDALQLLSGLIFRSACYVSLYPRNLPLIHCHSKSFRWVLARVHRAVCGTFVLECYLGKAWALGLWVSNLVAAFLSDEPRTWARGSLGFVSIFSLFTYPAFPNSVTFCRSSVCVKVYVTVLKHKKAILLGQGKMRGGIRNFRTGCWSSVKGAVYCLCSLP